MHWIVIASRLGDSYKHSKGGGSSIWIFMIVGGAMLLMGAGWYLWDQKQKKSKPVAKKKTVSLFQELCKLHRLTSSETELLQQAIHHNSLKQGAVAFLDPNILIQQATNHEADAEKWVALREKLFGA